MYLFNSNGIPDKVVGNTLRMTQYFPSFRKTTLR